MSNPFFSQPLLHLKCWCVQPPRCLVPHSAPCCLCVPVVLHVHVCLMLEAQLQYALLPPLWTPLMQIKIKTRRGGGQKRRTKFFLWVRVCVCVHKQGGGVFRGEMGVWAWMYPLNCRRLSNFQHQNFLNFTLSVELWNGGIPPSRASYFLNIPE